MAQYPSKIHSDRADVYATLSGENYAVHFPYSPAAVDAAKAALKAPKFDRVSKAWLTKKRWHKQLRAQLDDIAAVVEVEADKAADAEIEAQRERQAAAKAGRAAIEAMTPYKAGITVDIRRDVIVFHTAYHAEIVSLFRSLGGEFDRATTAWHLPMAAGVAIAENRQNIADWHNETVHKDQAREQAKQKRRANRYMARVADAPTVNSVIRRGDCWYRVEGTGKAFRANEDTSSLGGPIGAEGELICYVYLAAATASEIEAAQQAEREQQAVADQARARRESVAIVAAGEPAPHTGEAPAGETIWRDDRNAATGLRYWVVLAEDGYLHHLAYDGTDGAAWGDYNAGRNTHARRVPATDALVSAIREG